MLDENDMKTYRKREEKKLSEIKNITNLGLGDLQIHCKKSVSGFHCL